MQDMRPDGIIGRERVIFKPGLMSFDILTTDILTTHKCRGGLRGNHYGLSKLLWFIKIL